MQRKRTSSPSASANEHGSIRARALRAFNRVYCHGFHRIDVQSPPNLPAKGPAILVCNHISGLDPLLLQSVVARPIIWMMAREYYELKALRWLYEAVEAIPVERNGRDSSATRAALRALGNGRVLGIFPEGRIETSCELLPFQTGVAMMAIRTRALVVPTHIEGTNRGKNMLQAFISANNVKLRFGQPIHLADNAHGDKPDLNISTDRILQSVLKLKRETV